MAGPKPGSSISTDPLGRESTLRHLAYRSTALHDVQIKFHQIYQRRIILQTNLHCLNRINVECKIAKKFIWRFCAFSVTRDLKINNAKCLSLRKSERMKVVKVSAYQRCYCSKDFHKILHWLL